MNWNKQKNRGRVETQPRFKIQSPMKNRDKDALYKSKRCTFTRFFFIVFINKKSPRFRQGLKYHLQALFYLVHYLFHQFYRPWHIR